MKRLLFRADDLGYSEGVNLGIAKSVKEGLIKSVGLMANMDTAKQGISFLQETNISIGLHCNISAGNPITASKLIPSLVEETGAFKNSFAYIQAGTDIVNLDEAILEIEAQYQRFIILTGKKPSYMDGHAIASHNFFTAIQTVAKNHNILYSPLPHSEEEGVCIGSMPVYIHGGSSLDVDPYETLSNILKIMKEDESHMIVYHPGFIDAFILENSSLTTLRAFELKMLCDKECLNDLQRIKQISYDDLLHMEE